MNSDKITYEALKEVYKQMHRTNIAMGLNNAMANLKASECLWNMCETLEIEPLLLGLEDDTMYILEIK